MPDKNKAFSEIIGVLKPDGYFCVSDEVIKGYLPDKICKNAGMYLGVGIVGDPIEENQQSLNDPPGLFILPQIPSESKLSSASR